MPSRLQDLPPTGIDPGLLELLIAEHQASTLPRLQRFWDYYRNPAAPGPGGGAGHGLAQERGLPARLTGAGTDAGEWPAPRREIVIENDIAWRIHALVDFMFGRPFVVQSLAADPARAQAIETLLRDVFDANGGIGLFQDLALLGSIYGHVDLLLRVGDRPAGPPDFVLELVEPLRAIPLLDPDDYRRLEAYVLHYRRQLNAVEPAGALRRLRQRLTGAAARRASVACTEVWTGAHWCVLREGQRVEGGVNRLGRIPVVHIQNLAQPFFYEGLSDVEPLIPLQDELNTRLCDRANRVTFQSFKMYLGRGIDGFCDRPVGPGQMWATDNAEASIQEFGGDAASPSEDAHIGEIRDAMDKVSGVNAVVAGLLRDKVGNLTSENALRIVLLGVLSKTERRRVTYGAGLERLCELILHAADVAAVLPNVPADRRVRIDWPSPLPENTLQRLEEAELKLALGVPRPQVLAELGYAEIA